MKCRYCKRLGVIYDEDGRADICVNCYGIGKVTLKIWLNQLYEKIGQLKTT